MKALTLWQPWATLLAIGEKRIETRPWSTKFRGPVAIHASARTPNWKHLEALHGKGAVATARELLAAHGYETDADLARGAVVATCELVDVVPIEQARLEIMQGINLPHADPAEFELAFGDYSPKRWAFLLARIVRLVDPIPASGRLGLWDLPEEIVPITLPIGRVRS